MPLKLLGNHGFNTPKLLGNHFFNKNQVFGNQALNIKKTVSPYGFP
jgi:hypothetical protein